MERMAGKINRDMINGNGMMMVMMMVPMYGTNKWMRDANEGHKYHNNNSNNKGQPSGILDD